MILLETIGLRKKYRQGPQTLEILKGVNVTVRAGEFLAIMGSSGAGKSTLLHLLGGLDRPSAGTIQFKGQNVAGFSDRELARLRNQAFGFVFQFYHLVPELTALENVLLPAWIRDGRHGSIKAAQEGEMLLKRMGLAQRAAHFPSQLSGGEQQRVAIARALVNKPQMVFCDEPTGNLDAKTGAEIIELLVTLNREQKMTFVVVTHEQTVTTAAHRTLTLKDGQLWP